MKAKFLIYLLVGLAMPLMSQTYDTVWLSSLDLSKATIGWGGRGKDVSCMGNPIRLNGVEYEKGFGTHANSMLYVRLFGDAQRFQAVVGINDEEKKNSGSVVFSIYGGGGLIWRSSVLRSNGPSEHVNINVSRIDTLILTVDGAGDGISYDHGDWADAYFLVSGKHPETIERGSEKAVVLTPKPGAKPRINGPAIYGARPGHEIMYRIPVTGVRPVEYSAQQLPDGLTLDKVKGIIKGRVRQAGNYEIVLQATNELGTATKKFTLVIGKTISLTPPLGWNSWNCFGCSVTQEQVKAAADAMVNSGLADHGWTYINIDDCWMPKPGSDDPVLGGETRDASGNINTNGKFPDIKALTDYVHSLGLKIGIYSGPGPKTCAGFEASYLHEEADAKRYGEWGIDYLKYDWCDYERIATDHSLSELKKPYIVMREALDKVDRDIVYSLCQYGMGEVWKWGEDVGGNCWRTTGDILDDWSSMEGIGFNQAGLESYAGPGHWNDPDMLVVGKVGWGPDLHPTRLTPDEQYTHISLWALLAAPLLIGCDMTQLDDFTLNLLTNDEVLDINQDPLGKQASRILQREDLEIWAKDLADGSIAVGLFNRGFFPGRIVMKWSDLGISGNYSVRDVWRQSNLGVYEERFETDLPSHGVVLLRISRSN